MLLYRWSLWGGYDSGYKDALGIYVRRAYDWEPYSDFAFSIHSEVPAKKDDEHDEIYSWMGFSKSQFDHYGSFEKMVDAIFEADLGKKAQGLQNNQTRKDHQTKILREAARLVINLCAYLQQPKRLIDQRLDEAQEVDRLRHENAHRKQRRASDEKRAMKRVTRLSSIRLLHLGFNRIPQPRGNLETGHAVCAHWHNYWVGSGETRDLELRWIFEYFKTGTDGKTASETSRIYEFPKKEKGEIGS